MAAVTAGVVFGQQQEIDHPFLGANSEMSNLQRDDGSVAIKLNKRKNLVHKHDYLIEKSSEFS